MCKRILAPWLQQTELLWNAFPCSEECPLHRCDHYIEGIGIPKTARVCTLRRVPITELYASIVVSTDLTVADGDCAVDVMAMMLAIPLSFETR